MDRIDIAWKSEDGPDSQELVARFDPDLQSLAARLADIKRFNYPGFDRIIDENVLQHVVSCLEMCDANLGSTLLERETAAQIRRILMIHDLPEIATGDTLVTSEVSEDRAANIATAERQFIAERFTPSDQQLYASFETARLFLKGRGDINPYEVSFPAVIANIIDGIDGALKFHHSMAVWLGSDEADHDFEEPRLGYHYFFNVMHSGYRLKVKELEVGGVLDARQSQIATNLLSAAYNYICGTWSLLVDAEPDMVPVSIKGVYV